MALLMDMAHLDESIVRVTIEFPGGLRFPDESGHPQVVRAGGGKKLFHQRCHLEGQLWILTVAPH
jgi:hypothetical protein